MKPGSVIIAIENGCIHVKGVTVRWPNGLETRSDDPIRITVDGADRQVVFTPPQPYGTAKHPPRLHYRRY